MTAEPKVEVIDRPLAEFPAGASKLVPSPGERAVAAMDKIAKKLRCSVEFIADIRRSEGIER